MASQSFRTPLLWLLIPIIGGYIAGHHLPILSVWISIPVAGLFIILSLFYAHRHATRSTLWPTLILLGVFIASLSYYQQSRIYPEHWAELPAREAHLTMKVKRLYASRDQEVTNGIAEITHAEDHLKSLIEFPIFFSIETADLKIHRGQYLESKGVLSYLPAKDSPTLFEKYLIGQSIPLIFNRAVLQEVPKEGTPFERFISHVRKRAIDSLGLEMDPYQEELSIYRGMMLGIKGGLSEENKELFIRTGTLHLFAISGLHVGIVAVTWAGIFLVLRIPKQVSVFLGLTLVYLYVEVTGASPSAVRAFAMTAFFWLGQSLVRQMPPFQALVASAVVVLIISPTQLFSAGFQLSYTVVSGILLWGIPLYQYLRERRQRSQLQKEKHQNSLTKLLNKTWEVVVSTFCISLSATLASAPLSILYFGLMAPFAVCLNMLLVPSASLIIIAGLFSIITGFLPWLSVSAFFNHGPLLLISLMGTLLDWIVTLPFTFLPMHWSWEGLAFLTVLLFISALLFGHGCKLRKRWLFCFPVVLSSGMIFVNSLIQSF